MLAMLLLASVVGPPSATGSDHRLRPAARLHGPLTLLSYNVEGLAWPLTHGRAEAAQEIAGQLLELTEGTHRPGIVAVQEAFGAAQKAIGAEAGYPYSAFGPDAGLSGTIVPTGADRAFMAGASLLHGEREGSVEDSGLAIFSDYPIVAAWTMPFPRFACAGYDCLANKGLLVVAVRIPGLSEPLIVVDTHLNSRTASGVGDPRSLAAYERQVDLLSAAIGRLREAGATVVLAGDFNVGSDARRGHYLSKALLRSDGLKVAASELACGEACRSLAAIPSIAHAKTIVLFGGSVVPEGRPRGFGLTDGGRRLSDHLGILQRFSRLPDGSGSALSNARKHNYHVTSRLCPSRALHSA
jgi:endonuclease/exonuclease/phosphatase family metal-dependent hydrolase